MIIIAIGILLGLVLAAGVYVFLTTDTTEEKSGSFLDERLKLYNQQSDKPLTSEQLELQLPFRERIIQPIIDRFNAMMAERTPAKTRAALDSKLHLAGRPGNMTVGSFISFRYGAAGAGAVLGFLFGLLMHSILWTLLLPIGLAAAGYFFPLLWLKQKVDDRRKQITKQLPDVMDLLTISVEAGLGFDAAMARVTEKYHNALASEFSRVLNEIRLGRPRSEALDDMGKRNKVDELNTFVQAIIQSEQLGVGIANVLRIQSEEMRRRRRQRAEEQGQKAPLKMLFPMVGCIFPTLFIVLLGPAVIKVFDQFAGK